MKKLNEIKAEVTLLAKLIGASTNDLPTYGRTRDFGYPHIEVNELGYHYVVVERGQELERKTTNDYDELLYWIFEDATHNLAFAYELKSRIEDQDCRRIAFPKQIELMTRISSKMAARLREEIAEVLRRAPYDDEPTKAVNRMRRDKGI